MSSTLDEERWLALDRDYRRQVRKVYYRREEDFATLDAYNDYLEEVEEVIEGLINEKTRPAARARLDKLKAGDPTLTARNRGRLDEDRNAMSEAVEREKREAQQRAQQRLHEAQAAAEEEARVKAVLQDEVAGGKSVAEAQADLLRRRAAAPPATAAAAAPATAPTNQGYSYAPTSMAQARSSRTSRRRPAAQPLIARLPLPPKRRRSTRSSLARSHCTSRRTRGRSFCSRRSCSRARSTRTTRRSWRRCAAPAGTIRRRARRGTGKRPST